jgi:hypothetical protein
MGTLARVSDGTHGMGHLGTNTHADSGDNDDAWARSCASAGTPRFIFGAPGAGCRVYDYLLGKWQASDIATVNKGALVTRAVCQPSGLD